MGLIHFPALSVGKSHPQQLSLEAFKGAVFANIDAQWVWYEEIGDVEQLRACIQNATSFEEIISQFGSGNGWAYA